MLENKTCNFSEYKALCSNSDSIHWSLGGNKLAEGTQTLLLKKAAEPALSFSVCKFWYFRDEQDKQGEEHFGIGTSIPKS